MSTTSINFEQASKRKSLATKAELAVAEALSKARKSKGLSDKQVSAERKDAQFNGSYFFTTDQLAHFSFGETGFYTTEAEARRFDAMNIEQDIDLVIADLFTANNRSKLSHSKAATVSVKAMNKALETNNISIEMKTFNDRNPSIQRKGWVYTSKATHYAFAVGSKVMVLTKTKLLEIMAEGHWEVREHISEFAKSFNEGRTYNDAQNMLIPVSAILEHSTVFELSDWYVQAWKNSSRTSDKQKALNDGFWARYGV